MGYQAIYSDWQQSPGEFWLDQSSDIDWITPPQTAYAEIDGLHHWFPDGLVNTCYNCLDRHVMAGHGDRTALIYDSPLTQQQTTISYSDLLVRVSHFAGVLRSYGLGKGDRVIIYMPMILETAIAALACARLGAIHSIVFGGFAAPELATRIDDAQPHLILSASCGIEPGRIIDYKPLLDGALELALHKPAHCIILQRPQSEARLIAKRDIDWREAEQNLPAEFHATACTPLAATDPLYILYTSGTTGIPKGVVRDNGGHLVALNWAMRNVYNIGAGDVFWSASDMGWVVGHSFILYGPLIVGATSIIYEGKPVGTPDAGAFWRVIAEHQVKALFTAPTAFRAIRKEDPKAELLQRYAMDHFEALFLAGERADPDTVLWAEQVLQTPVIDNWWQTETGWPICANPIGLETLTVKHGSPSVPMPGYDVRIVDETGMEVPAGTTGSVVIKLPLPPGCLPTLWENHEGYQAAYLNDFPGYYKTGDAGYQDEDGYLFIMSRTDDIINVAGHRLSTGGMEEVLSGHPDIVECAVLGVNDPLKGQIPLGLVVFNDGVNRPDQEILDECVARIRHDIGPVAAFKLIARVARLPKTRSGKILRGTVRRIANGESWTMPATIDDPSILDDMAETLRKLGYPQDKI